MQNVYKDRRIESIDLSVDGLVHDLNNILAVISGNVALLKMDTNPKRKETIDRLKVIENASRQASELTRHLLTVAGGASIIRSVAVTDLIYESIGFICAGTNFHCQVNIAEQPFPVQVAPAQVSQVLNNIIINACQAMPAGGEITVVVANITVESGDSLPLKVGSYVKISIADQGQGIPRENLLKIFDPYFTTKEKGSGLGLAISYSIIKKYAGHLNVESEPGIGTTFHIYLPAVTGNRTQDDIDNMQVELNKLV